MKIKFGIKIAILTIVCIALNVGGRILAEGIYLPVWLDTIGTVVAGYVLGPLCGAIVGGASNIIFGIMDPINYSYIVISVLVGVIVGMSRKKNIFNKYFSTMMMAFILTIIAVLVSTPLELIQTGGKSGNLWGDGVAAMLYEMNVPFWLSVGLGEFYVEFLDKYIILSVVFFFEKFRKHISKKKSIETIAAAICLVLILQPISAAAAAAPLSSNKDESGDYNYYVQTVYNNSNGIPSGGVNDIASTTDGIIWLATYSGLYRYNGTNFVHMNSFKSIKNVNRLYVDEENRMWIGTNDDGLSVVVGEEVVNVLDEKSGLPSNSVRSIVQQSTGKFFVGTSDSLAVVTLAAGIRVVQTFDEILYAKSLAADESEHVAAVNDQGRLYLITDDEMTGVFINSDDKVIYTCCFFDEDGVLYAGRNDGKIDLFDIVNDNFVLTGEMACPGLTSINVIYDNDGEMFICSDSGIGYFDDRNKFTIVNTGDFNTQIDSMNIDYQGNLWFTSSRQGLLKLCPSSFYEIYTKIGIENKVVNAVTMWQGVYYFGTDRGLDAVDKKVHNSINTTVTKKLSGIRVRCLTVDSGNNMWICTSGEGIYKATSDGQFKVFNSENGTLGDRFRCGIELSDGNMAFSGDNGITVINPKDNSIVYTLSKDDGLLNVKTLCLYQDEKGLLYAGTDGGGIFVIDNGKIIRNITREDGLKSGVILKMVKNSDDGGFFIVASNGLGYMDADGNIKTLDSFPYSNNYDILDDGSGNVFVMSSAGIYVVNKEKLVNDSVNDYILLNKKKGLTLSLTANAWNYVDDEGIAFLAAGTGVAAFNLKNYENSDGSYRMMIKSVTLDNVPHYLDNSFEISVARDVARIDFFPEVINYSVNDPYVKYILEGFDKDATVVLQSELGEISYTNLPAGTYHFKLSVLANDKKTPIEEMVYTIIKEKEIYDSDWFKNLFILETFIIIGWISWFITRTQIQRTINYQRKQLEFARKQIKMGDETIVAIARTVDAKDSNTSMHSTRVSEYSVLIAKKMGMSNEECEVLRKTALLHDIGKIGIPDSVLNKPDRLTDEEYEIMKSHVTKGAEILKDFSLIDHVAEGAMYHHERYDGKGYVHGLKGEEIPLNARIIGIADAFDAMTANRVYRKKLPPDVVLGEIKKGRGTQFDPNITDIFLELIDSKAIDIDSICQDGGIVNEK